MHEKFLLFVVFRFDIYSFGFDTEEDEKGMVDSARLINQVITSEIDSGIDANRIVLGGFSQGGTMSLMSGLTSERNLAGLAVLSGWLPLRKKFKSVCTSHQSLKLSECPYLIDGFSNCILYSCILGSWIRWSSRQSRVLQNFFRIPRSTVRDTNRKARRCQKRSFLPRVWRCWSHCNTERTGGLEGMDQESHP